MIKLNPLIENQINELSFQDISDWVGKTIENVKLFVSDVFFKKSEEMSPGEETQIVIPTNSLTEAIDPMLLTNILVDIKGNLNEAMTCINIIQKKLSDVLNKNITLLPKYSKEHIDTLNKYKKLMKRLREIPDSPQKEYTTISVKNGSIKMSEFIVSNAKQNNFVVNAAYISNLEYLTSSENKGDIVIALTKKIGKITKEELTKYSLKLYKGRDIKLDTTGIELFIKTLTNNNKKSLELFEQFRKKYEKPFREFRRIEQQYEFVKEVLKRLRNNEDAELYVQNATMVSDEFKRRISLILKKSKSDDLLAKERDSLSEERTQMGTGINKSLSRAANVVLQNFIRSPKNKEIFIQNLLKRTGLDGNETKTLMAIVNDNGTFKDLITAKPELDLNKIKIEDSNGTVGFNITNQGKKIFRIEAVGAKYIQTKERV